MAGSLQVSLSVLVLGTLFLVPVLLSCRSHFRAGWWVFLLTMNVLIVPVLFTAPDKTAGLEEVQWDQCSRCSL